jgi:ATP-binding cassette, subfamily A (ABC1), member 3
MVNGEFKCLGSTQHLKNKFGEGFVLTLKLKRKSSDIEGLTRTESQEMFEEKNSVKEFIKQKFEEATLK